MMNGRGKSDSAIVAERPTNKAGRPAEGPEERRAETEENAVQQSTRRAQNRESVSQALDRIRQAARQRKKEKFTALLHHISPEHLEAAFFELKENAAPGVDGLTWRAYEEGLDAKILDLHSRLHKGAYRALPSRRIYIPKPDGRQRPLAASGDMIIVRYADDIIVGFQYETDARRFWDAMRERLAEYSLSLHPEKSRLIEFGRFASDQRARRGLGKPETFNFLGFTFICGRSRRGRFALKRKSRGDRMRATLQEIKKEMQRRMHQPIPEQGKWLRQVATGFFAYHAVPTNRRALHTFRHCVTDLWRRSLRRRSQKDRMTWSRIKKLADDFLPQARILHPWPHARFAVKHPRWEPSALVGHARICAGGAQ